jgi:ceramide glucosyltransferase
MNALFLIFAALTVIGVIVYGLQIIAVRRTLASCRSGTEAASAGVALPAISILKPLKGLDDNLFDNLDSFCNQNYPAYEIIFSLQDHNDPASKIARKIQEKHPGKNIRIIIEPCRAGLNPKVNNLIPAYRASRFDAVLISDSNVLVGPDYLRSIAGRLADPSVGLVTNLIRGTGGRTVGSILENLHLNSFIVGSVCFLDRYLGMPCVIGKSMLMRKRDLEAIGGFEAVKDVLAEDYIIGREMHRNGRRVAVSEYLINNVNQYWTVGRFLNRHTRWGKLRWKIGGYQYLSELATNPVFTAFLALLAAGPSWAAGVLASTAALLKIIGDRSLGAVTGSSISWNASLLVPMKDLIIGFLWFVPLMSDTVVWRGNRYVLDRDSKLSPHPGQNVWSWPYRIGEAIKARFA